MASSIHPTAIVEEGVELGDGTKVWHHAHLREGAVVGAGCTLGMNVFVDAGVVVGDRVKIQNNVSLYAGVELADEVFVGPGAVFTNDRVPRSTGKWAIGRTVVSRGASIGANATVIAGLHIGEWAMVGAGAVVTHDVAAHELVAGNPARRLGWTCRCGTVRLRAVDLPVLRCSDCGTALPTDDRTSPQESR